VNLLKNNNQNFIRLRVSETPRADVGINPAPGWNGASPWYQAVSPLPYPRTGNGNAADGKKRFRLNEWDQTFFDRLRARVIAARDQGIYVSIMLFNGWTAWNRADAYSGRNVWRYHPFNSGNNGNGISGDTNGNGDGEEIHSLQVAAITQLQEAYVRKVIDTVNDLDNVLYEISHEDFAGDSAWQYSMINVVKNYELTKPKQHPVGMTGSPQIAFTVLQAQPGQWTSPSAQAFNSTADPYASNPPAADGTRISLLDTDHIGYMIYRDDAAFTRAWVWKSFLRGHHPVLMEDLGGNSGWLAGRSAMGHTRTYAGKMNLATMTPQGALSSTGYCLANAGNEYLVFQSGSGAFTVNLAGNSYAYEWFNPATGSVASTGTVGASGGNQTFTPPFTGPAVLYLKATGVVSNPPTTPTSSSTSSPTVGTSYQASTNFSGTQGQNGWYYQDSLGRMMTFNSAGNYWQGAETYLLLTRFEAHPGSGADAVRRWVAPGAGTVQITGQISDLDGSCGGGVMVSIRNGSTVLWQQVLANGNTTGIAFNVTTGVSTGTTLDFVLNQGSDGNNWCDWTIFDPLITYTSIGTSTTSTTTTPPTTTTTSTTTYRASTDFSGIQGQRGWYYQDSLGRLMTYNVSGAYWQGAETYLLISSNKTHPGNAADAVRRWVSPAAGAVRITGNVADADASCGGGMTASIRTGSTVLWQQAIANGNTAGINFDVTANVSSGTSIDFVANRGSDGTNSCDTTTFDPVITLTIGGTLPASSSTTATISWNANTEADLAGYRLYQRTTSTTYGQYVPLGKVTSYTASNLTVGTVYYFRLTAVDNAGNVSIPSAEVSIQK
jgi:hypothetical protein